MSRILVVEDDADIASLIVHYLAPAGHESEVVANGSDALPAARKRPPDLGAVPILMLTARAEEVDRIAGFETGADDYVTKPFSPKELVARIGALLRRVRRGPADEPVLRYGPLVIDVERHVVTDGDHEVRLTAKEYLLLHYFLEHRGRVLSRDLLLTDVWGYQYTGGTRTVDVHVRRLREKLPVLVHAVETIKQFGYKLKIDGADGDAS